MELNRAKCVVFSELMLNKDKLSTTDQALLKILNVDPEIEHTVIQIRRQFACWN